MNDQEKAAMRVEIAKDAIEQIKVGRFIPDTGVYLRIEGKPLYRQDFKQQLKDLVAGTRCSVCALGAVFVATVDKRNAITLSEVLNFNCPNPKRFRDYLEDLFSREQLCLIEMAFEQFGSPDRIFESSVEITNEEADSCLFWASKFPDHYNRLIAILENVIRNDGTFKPADLLPQVTPFTPGLLSLGGF